MVEAVEEAVYQRIRESEAYQTVLGHLIDMIDDGDECAFETLTMINVLIPPEKKQAGDKHE